MDFDQQYIRRDCRPSTVTGTEPQAYKGCFDCSICLDLAYEPVVTLCGHLYCWPCIYKWLQVQSLSDSLAIDEPPQCPVCKAGISHTDMVPLYGRGKPDPPYGGKTTPAVPPRPPAANNTRSLAPAPSTVQQLPYRNPYRDGYPSGAASQLLGNLDDAGIHHSPMLGVGMFGEMVYARVFRNSDSLLGYINPYNLRSGSDIPRLRRQEMQADKSLNRISIFLFCCFLLCLLVF